MIEAVSVPTFEVDVAASREAMLVDANGTRWVQIRGKDVAWERGINKRGVTAGFFSPTNKESRPTCTPKIYL